MSLDVARQTQLGWSPGFYGRSPLSAHPPCRWRDASCERLDLALPPSVLAGRGDADPLLLAWVATRRRLHAPHLGAASCSRPELIEEPSRCQHRGGSPGSDASGSGLRSCMHSMGHPLRSPPLAQSVTPLRHTHGREYLTF